MAVSIAVFKAEKFDLLKKIEDGGKIELFSKPQTTISEHFELPPAKSTIKLKEKSEDKIIYTVEHFSDTIKRPILTWSNHLFIDNGYQEKSTFEIIHDTKKNEVYIITRKPIASQIKNRLESLKGVKLKKCDFCLNVTQIKNILNVYGIWDKVSEGNIKVQAKFGSNVLEEIRAKETTIAINMKIKIDEEEFDVTISADGQISSHSRNMTTKKLLDFFNSCLRDELMKNMEIFG